MTTVEIAPATDLAVVSSLLAQAFADDPVITWMQPDRGRHRAFFDVLLKYSHSGSVLDLATRDGAAVGAAVWDPPGYKPSTAQNVLAGAAYTRVLGTRVRRGAVIDHMCEVRRPEEPHWYLADLGAAVQGMGVGSALLRAGVDRLDAPAHLESSNDANIPLYERFGFEVTGEIHLPDGGPTLWTMYRRA